MVSKYYQIRMNASVASSLSGSLRDNAVYIIDKNEARELSAAGLCEIIDKRPDGQPTVNTNNPDLQL